MIRIVIQEKVGIDIFVKETMPRNINIFENYLKTLKTAGLGYVAHYAEVTKEDLQKVLETLDTRDPQQLQWLVWINIQLHLCRRGFQNSANMKKKDLVIEKCGDFDIIRLARNSQEKNHVEIDEDGQSGGRIASIPGNSKCPVLLISHFLDKLNPLCDMLWQRPRKKLPPHADVWYENAPLGHNTLRVMMKKISTFCGLSEIYTNHCLRVSSCSLLGEAGYTDLDIAAISKHKSLSSLGVYKRVKDYKKVQMSHSLSEAMGLSKNAPQTMDNMALLTPQMESPSPVIVNSNLVSHNPVIEEIIMSDDEWASFWSSYNDQPSELEQPHVHEQCCVSYGTSNQAAAIERPETHIQQNTVNQKAIKKEVKW
jgi:hypothetical protein